MQTVTLYKQIHPDHCSVLARLGYRSLINLRTDGESPAQPSSDSIARAALQHKLHYCHLPVDANDRFSLALARDFADILRRAPKPALVFCATGGRAKRLYQSAAIAGLLDAPDRPASA